MDITGAIPGHVGTDYGYHRYGYNSGCNNGCNDRSNNVDHDTILRSLSDIRMEGKEIEAELLQTAAANTALLTKDITDSTFRLHENIRNVADQILVSSNLTQAQVASTAAMTQAQIAAAKASTDLLICEKSASQMLAGEKNTATILAALAATELRQLQDELNEARLERNRYHSEVNFGNQLNVVQSQINKLDQIQRSTNQAINFGSGKIGEQTSTSNQVR